MKLQDNSYTKATKYTNQNTKYANQNNNYADQNIKYTNKNQPSMLICSLKYINVNFTPRYWFTLFCREAVFVANLRTFLVYFLQA